MKLFSRLRVRYHSIEFNVDNSIEREILRRLIPEFNKVKKAVIQEYLETTERALLEKRWEEIKLEI